MKSSEAAALPTSARTQRLLIAAELTKLRLSMLVLVTVGVSWFAASWSGVAGDLAHDSLVSLIGAILGVLGTAGGACTVNQIFERDVDARMKRTRERPLPSGRVSVDGAIVFGMLCMLAGILILFLLSGPIPALLGLLSALIYVAIYTPLKRMTTLNTIVGAVSGALPPMIGWTAVTQRVDANAWALFGILFVWQIPHFLAIAWLYRDDYERAGMRMLGVIDVDGRLTMRQILLWGLVMVPVSLVPVATGLCGPLYAGAAIILGFAFLLAGIRLIRSQTRSDARRLFFASLIYLPLLLAALLLDIGIS